MARSTGRDRQRDFEELTTAAVHEHDPEQDISEDEDEDDTSDELPNGRAHYAPVSKSKLRKPKETALGPQYRGSRIDRDDLSDDEDDEDDPFSKDFEDEDSELDAEEEEGQSGPSDEEDEEDEDSTDDTEISIPEPRPIIDKSELRKAMAAEQSTVAATLSAAGKADAEKGRAVLQQRTTFDALLNARIKLQKSLIASNSLVALDNAALTRLRANTDAIASAETAALTLATSLLQLRQELDAQRTGEKRKALRTDLDTQIRHLAQQEKAALSHRQAILQKWSMKSRAVSAAPQRSQLNNEQPATIVDVLNEHLANGDRLLKKVRTPRSCAPIQLAKGVEEDANIYDDADFYGLLLKELLESKQSASAAAATNIDLGSFHKLRRDAKAKRNVDTKASKGRKLRYTIHEKLQNYCAPEDRTSWNEQQAGELFTSLFGHNLGLQETALDADQDVADADISKMLFSR